MTRYELTDAERKWVEERMCDCVEYLGEEMMLVATNGRWAVLENAQGETGRVLVSELMRDERTRTAERCPGCGRGPGDGLTAGCSNPNGCGYWREVQEQGRKR